MQIKPKIIRYNNRTFCLQTSGRYYQDHNRSRTPERLLHRRIWHDSFGPIPDGHHIHHKDGDWTNNSLDNLECIHGSKHASNHMKEKWANPNSRLNLLNKVAQNREKTKAWHASEEGRKWHSENAKKSWKTRPFKTIKCVMCGCDFESQVSTRKFCSEKCSQKNNIPNRPKTTKKCVMCGDDFMCRKYAKTSTCSVSCRSYLIAFNRKDLKNPPSKKPIF